MSEIAAPGAMTTLDPAEQKPQDIYKLLVGSVVPRPIAFVSSMDADGVRNLAPFSFFTVASANPPIVCFCPMMRRSAQSRIAAYERYIAQHHRDARICGECRLGRVRRAG